MTRLFKILTIVTSLFLLSFTVYADSKEAINVSNIEWGESEFVYDNTIKTVELVNVPSNITITYENNSFKEVGTYFASAYINYDKDHYYLVGYDPEKFENFCWTIVMGKYNTSNMSFKDVTVVYNGKPHSIIVSNIPEGVQAKYTGNERIEPGEYEIKVEFEGDPYYHKIQDMTALLTINKAELVCDDGETKVKSRLYGFHPNAYMKHEEFDNERYDDLDLSKLGSYREVKTGFKLTIYDKNHNIINVNDDIIVEIKLTKDVADSEFLEVYEYSSTGISKVNSSLSGTTISFSISSLNSEFVLIGMRETYSKGDNWKIGLIFLVVVVFIVMIFVGRKVHNKHRFK